MKLRKLLALVMALAMTLSLSVTALADNSQSGSGSGTGSFEGSVDTDVFQVEIPTSVAFDFIADPEGLIQTTDGAAYAGATFAEDGTLYFAHVDNNGTDDDDSDDTTTYKTTSPDYTITNKSTMAVDVTVNAKVSNITGITMAASSTIADTDPASMYLALAEKDASNTAVVTSAAAGVDLKGSATAAPEGSYELKRVAAVEDDPATDDVDETAAAHYAYTLKADADGFDTFIFNLTGAAGGDWSEVDEAAAPSIALTWTVSEHVTVTNKGPSVAQSSYTMAAGQDLVVNVDLGVGDLAATRITAATFSNNVSTDADFMGFCTIADDYSTITVASATIDTLISAKDTVGDITVKITFDKGDPVIFTMEQPA